MMTSLSLLFVLLGQVRASDRLHPFKGFVPDEATAVGVARPIFRAMLGEEYVKRYEPLYATKILGRWVVGGRAAGFKPGEMFFEPYKIAIDPHSARVVAFSYVDDSILRDLRKTPPDGIPETKATTRHLGGSRRVKAQKKGSPPILSQPMASGSPSGKPIKVRQGRWREHQ